MAIDGSFSLQCAVERFLARCPKLQSIPQFESFKKKGYMEEEEVVKTVANVFLLPNYTVSLTGCFRPIAGKIVDRVVGLLRFVPNLRSNSKEAGVEVEEDMLLLKHGVIEFYNRVGKGLDLHEFACLAFCRALDLAPFLLGSVLTYFGYAPPPFQRLIIGSELSELCAKAGSQLSRSVWMSYRLLLMEPEIFARLWDWSCFLDLLKESTNLDLCRSANIQEVFMDAQWTGTRIVSIVFKLSEKVTDNFLIGDEDAFSCLLRWEEFCQDVSLEKAGWYIEPSKPNELEFTVDSQKCSLQSLDGNGPCFSSPRTYLERPYRCQRVALWDNTSSGNPFVLTSAVKRSFEMVLLAVSQKWPVLLYGPSGSGKSSLIAKLAQDRGEQVLSIHMDDQIDGKTLVGSYVCTERPGEFKWKPGSLTQAVLNGYWIVFEDIDKAPSDVHSVLLPLLEGTSSFATGHGEEIQVAESFRLFSTISTSRHETFNIIEGGNTLSVFWRRVMVGSPSAEDLLRIVKASYPSLEPLAEKLIETFDMVKSTSGNQLDGFHGHFSTGGYLTKFSLRDLLKWCKRIGGLGLSVLGNNLSSHECYCIYQEAVDIFAAFSTSIDNRLAIRKVIARLWGISPSVAETNYPASKPIIQDSLSDIRIGRVSLLRTQTLRAKRKFFVEIRSSLHLLERLAASVKYNESVLMVGETGTGKTTLIQDLAMRLGQKLTVLNLSQQSDIADLLGGFKPVDTRSVCFLLYKEFEDLFSRTFSVKDNSEFLSRLRKALTDKRWIMLLKGFRKGVNCFRKSVEQGLYKSGEKRKKPLGEETVRAWESFSVNLEAARGQIDGSSGIIFSFVEGAFVNALKNGEWILLDEVNLAPSETLQRVIGVFEGDNGSLCLAERGDVSYICRHPNFRLFACMNPATDAGKRDLPFSIRSRFTEFFVDEVLDEEELTHFVNEFMADHISDPRLVNKIVHFFKAAKQASEDRLQDGANQKPQYSMRSLYRAIEYTRKAERTFGFQNAIYDGFCMFFQNMLDGPSAKIMNQMILSYLLASKIPRHVPFCEYITPKINSNELKDDYILTRSVRENLRDVARAILIKRYPVLLQGPTSSGKTSLVRHLAEISGQEFLRINNHEHTDLQEYLGTYITDASGKLVFHEGILVKAVRNGCWIVLDELNLAPSDVLEALNRLLDDNRELFVPELQETVRAHPDFMLFATQNPPTFYGGRKMLSRAFRNRFVEIHVDEIPEDELSTIVEQRCKIPGKYAKKMVDVMQELQLNRQRSKVFAGKHGYITPRDLFRWAERFRKSGGFSAEDLARDGYYLLAERLREESEKHVIRDVLEKHLRVKLVENNLYNEELGEVHDLEAPQSIIWTRSMKRLYFLVERCYRMQEPVLLVGETGGGKTSVCQLLSNLLGLKLHILNCHQYTETSDFLGGFYPLRERPKLILDYKRTVEELVMLEASDYSDFTLSSDINQAPTTILQLERMMKRYKQNSVLLPEITNQHLKTLEVMIMKVSELYQKWQTIFTWQDGSLVEAMRDGGLFLVDEISLADDSVLERLNSVLEPERTLSLAEKGGPELENIIGHDKFLLLATMNPGGDFGKKELSPALRNRFTEIWVPPVCNTDELKCIASHRLSSPLLTHIVEPILSFLEWFSHLQTGRMLTVRDLLSWVDFVNVTESMLGAEYACLHGMFLVVLDGISLGSGISKNDAGELRHLCLSFMLERMKVEKDNLMYLKFSTMQNYGWGDFGISLDECSRDSMLDDDMLGIDPFYIQKGTEKCKFRGFEFQAPTTRRNALRVLRAMQLPKPVLLEGSPGVGKTSLIVALAEYSGHRVVRVNLSEQTDIMDLLGSDLPVESDDGIKFAWSDGILLQALKEGCWVLLDELNLASQSVLEGLNAILDHRAEVFIPELGRRFKCPSSFRIFACQNPSCQGGGRKGLPKSFLNRFIKVYVDELVEEDYHSICSSLFSVDRSLLTKLILFNKRLYEDTMVHRKFAQDGFPWEFNLRDVIRSCEIIEGAPAKSQDYCFLNLVYIQRMRTEADRRQVLHLYEEIFEVKPFLNLYPRVQLNSQYLIVGDTSIRRNSFQSSKICKTSTKILPGICQSLEAVTQCVKHQWLCILVGPESSGKTSLIRILAELTGNVLNELHLSSGTDISEILGCFEQYNAIRNFHSVVSHLECYINEYCNLKSESSKESFIIEEDLITRWFTFLSRISHNFLSCFTSSDVEQRRIVVDCLALLSEIIQKLKLVLDKNDLSLSWSSKELDRAMKGISKLQDSHQRRTISAKFEWVTGLLIKAIECGEWIVLENANCCNPTVLDRINSLVEPSGSITVNECGIVDGKPVTLYPHSNFRMFLTINPSYGQMSRAMRNRGVEIFLMQPCWSLDEISGFKCDEFELEEVKRFLVLSGIPVARLVEAMANSHIYAKKCGRHFNISITYLELTRWVQLFQQLIMYGNKLFWSLHTSWEHIYLSSLGEADGANIVGHAKHCYLSVTKLSPVDISPPSPLCLPGGWPLPLKLRDFVLCSRVSTVKQNCMYLEFLAAQCVSHELEIARNRGSLYNGVASCGYTSPYSVDVKMLHGIMFPGEAYFPCSKLGDRSDLELVKKKTWFAAKWTIEQAAGNDFSLYLLWFRWYSSRLQSLCQFFKLIELIVEHPIWKYLTYQYHELISVCQFDIKKQPIPMLSLEIVDTTNSKDMSIKFHSNAVNCIGLLLITFQQWNEECKDCDNERVKGFISILTSLHILEEDFLKKLVDSSVKLVESPLFDRLIQIYHDLLEHHTLFWNAVRSSNLGDIVISWRSLLKSATKLKDFCPEAVEALLRDHNTLKQITSWHFHSEKSLLWLCGGHPVLPWSAGLFDKQLQLLNLCELLWPTKSEALNLEGDWIKIIASSNSKLRFLATEGVSMLSSISNKFDYDEDEARIIQPLDSMYENLMKRFEHSKFNLEKILKLGKLDVLDANLSTSCSYTTEMMCQKAGFDSWQDTLPLTDITSIYLDMELLQELSALLVDSQGLELGSTSIYKHLVAALKFSLMFSSRPPQMFSPHQKILWILDAWTLVDAANAKLASFVLEMWFRWHQSLWIHHPDSVKSFSKAAHGDVTVPDMLFQPVMSTTVLQILKSTAATKDHFVGCVKINVASCSLWGSLSPGTKLPCFLLSAVRCLFEQIMYAHQKAFAAGKFAKMKSILCSLRTNLFQKESTKDERFQLIKSLIWSSNHHRLKMSVVMFIAPLLEELYCNGSSIDPFSNLGRAWLFLGGLRLNLLLGCDDLDPVIKYHSKFSRLEEKISSLKLEIQVRKDCNYTVGWLSTREGDKKQAQALENLEKERKRTLRKIVFRSDHKKFKNLKSECDEFFARAKSSDFLWNNNADTNLNQILSLGDNFQKTATSFIEKLSDNYPEYIDFIQPIQVAVYEMKLGLSLVVSSLMQKRILNRVKPYNMDVITESIYSFMRFPRFSPFKTVSVELSNELHELFSYQLEISTNFSAADIDLLEKLVTFSSDTEAKMQVSPAQQKASLYCNVLFRTAVSISNGRMMDSTSFAILDKVFSEFADIWMRTKIQSKIRENHDSQKYRFRHRAFNIDRIIELDISVLGKSLGDESYMEWMNLVAEDEDAAKEEACAEQENLENEQDLMEESVVNNVVDIHNRLFGSNSFLITGAFMISDIEKSNSFINSYMLGAGIIAGLSGSFLSSLDARLAPEHMLRLCLEHEQKLISSHKSARGYNFYKDSNALEMSKMMKVLYPLRQEVHSLLNEREDHYGLQKILKVIEMLLNIPLDMPLAKSLSGLQLLVNNIQEVQESGLKFPIRDQLVATRALMLSWKKMEFGSCPSLLDEVQNQCDINAGKLWFPLYSVFRARDITVEHTVESLEDFIHMSSIGEFRKRLQLLFAFLGQIHTGQYLNIYSSSRDTETLKALYNILGFYMQFLPRILEYIETTRRDIEKELQVLWKLGSWECSKISLSDEMSKGMRQKLKKLLQKYAGLLHQPVMPFLNQDPMLNKPGVQSDHSQAFLRNYMERNKGIINASSDTTLRDDEDRFRWYADWTRDIDVALRNLELGVTSGVHIPYSLSEGTLRKCSASQSSCSLYRDGWNAIQCTLKNILGTAERCGELWKDVNKNQGKRRALTELLKLLENIGLSRHKPVYLENQVKSWWFLQPSYDLQHLQMTQSRLTTGSSDVVNINQSKRSPCENLVVEWATADECYFKSVASVLFLQQISLVSHKDITREQVDRSSSFLHQLVEIQQKQHASALGFAKHLKQFKRCVSILKNLYSNSSANDNGTTRCFSVIQNQDTTLKCLWKQKLLFDCLCSISDDELFLLKSFAKTHLETCETSKVAANRLLASIEGFLPMFQNAKELLDGYLLCRGTDTTKTVASQHTFIISKEMEELVHQNFRLLKDFEELLIARHKEDMDRSSVKKTLLGHFDEVFKKGRLVQEEFISEMEGKNKSLDASDVAITDSVCSELNAEFVEVSRNIFMHIIERIERVCSPLNIKNFSHESLGNIASWEFLFESLVADMNLEHLSNELLTVIFAAKKLLKGCGDQFQNAALQIEIHLKQLDAHLAILANFGDYLLQELCGMHKTVSLMTRAIADVLASLYLNGFGLSSEEHVDDGTQELAQDASGTGMGEGAGLNDVSDQITDEDQLLGLSNKQGEERDASGDDPSKTEKGIEMDENFEADSFDVSEDSEEDMDEDGENEQLESVMGETGAAGEVVKEKSFDEEDGSPEDTKENHESGPPARDTDPSSRETTAKEDSAVMADEHEALDSQELGKSDDEIGNQDDPADDRNSGEDVSLDKEETSIDCTDVKQDEPNQSTAEDMELDEEDGPNGEEKEDNEREADTEAQDASTAENENPEEGEAGPNDEAIADAEQPDATSERNDRCGDHEQEGQINLMGSRGEMLGPGNSDYDCDGMPTLESLTQPKGEHATDSSSLAPESKRTTSNDPYDGISPPRGLSSDNTAMPDMMVVESSNGERKTSDRSETRASHRDSPPGTKSLPNPYRSVGDALEEWKRRAKVSVDLEADDTKAHDEIEDDNVDEYGYIPEFEKGSSQAIGLATAEQMDKCVNSNVTNENEPITHDEDLMEMEIEKQNPQTCPTKSEISSFKSKAEEKTLLRNVEEPAHEEARERENHHDGDFGCISDCLVSVRKLDLHEGVDQLRELSIDDHQLSKAQDASGDAIDIDTTLWRKYELLTTRLSQELAEQLRLVMEPTLASKLQGDYKTGKRINMKKVIPYIASHYRRDKIWLRRTRPNKRDYQVVIAVDDSRSMSERGCGQVAMEALVAVCRAMSQLEMGNFAVASFGKKGNVKLLHDFQQPFTGDAGVKMLSSLTFKQENTIADEPIVDLLKFLTSKLDSVVAKARLPSGQNPLQQLILIIGDGRFHESKAKLKRYVRDILSKKYMVAYLLLDNQEESIMNLHEPFEGGSGKFSMLSKYLDSFPFPYYIVLRNIEALPSTLASLLRQWMELMQHSRE